MGCAMRADPAYAHIPIIMMSALAEPAVREHFHDYSVFSRKPFRIPALVGAIPEILARRRSRD